MNFCIVKDHADLLKYIESLQAKNSDALGFLPRSAFERYKDDGQLFLGLLNGEPCGYVLAGSGFRGVLRLWQVCIQYDVRRRLYGAMLVAAVDKYGEDLGCIRSEVHCASDLTANDFWASVGYVLIETHAAGRARKHRRHINIWSKPLFPVIPATSWIIGRPRVYATNAERQAAYRARLLHNSPASGKFCNKVAPFI